MRMNKLGINRVWGIIIALGILITAFTLFNLLTYLRMDRQIKELEQTAMVYNANYKVYLETSETLRNYNKQISERAYELEELERMMKNIAVNYQKNGSKIIFSGMVDPEQFSIILNYISDTKTLKINKLDTQSQAELPLLIGESDTPNMYIKEMEIELIQIDDKVLEG
jgi:thioredoxin-related protein